MTEDLKGYFAFSLAGHDKGRVYYILNEDEFFVYLCDGNLKPLSAPKKKKKKHIRLIKTKEVLQTDSEIKKRVKELENVQG